MKFYLLFLGSGDYIPIVTDKPDLVKYYVEFLENHSANQFAIMHDLPFDIIKQYKEILDKFNSSIPGKLISFDNPHNEIELLDQSLLNKIHCEWVHSNHRKFKIFDLKQKYPTELQKLFDNISDDIPTVIFSEIIYKYDLQGLYQSVNMKLHSIESIFNQMFFQAEFDRDWGWIETENIFPKKYTSNSKGNLSLFFNHYGRHLYNKFLSFDTDLTYDDENTYNQLLGFVKLSLVPPETIPYSREYLEWCKKIGREPGGENLNIGNIVDLEDNLYNYRKMLYKNLSIKNNKFKLSFLK
jgi:hypothetical protein